MQCNGHTFWIAWMNCMMHWMYVDGQHYSCCNIRPTAGARLHYRCCNIRPVKVNTVLLNWLSIVSSHWVSNKMLSFDITVTDFTPVTVIHSTNLLKTRIDQVQKNTSKYSYYSQKQPHICIQHSAGIQMPGLSYFLSSFFIISFQNICQMFIISRSLELFFTLIGFLALVRCWFLRAMILHWTNTLVTI